MRLELGKRIRATDEVFGELADVVIDPIANRVTHLVAKPSGGGSARLVPIELVEAGGDDEDEIRLRCTTEEIVALDDVEEVAYLRLGETPTSDPDWDVGIENVLALPYYEGSELMGVAGVGAIAPAAGQGGGEGLGREIGRQLGIVRAAHEVAEHPIGVAAVEELERRAIARR